MSLIQEYTVTVYNINEILSPYINYNEKLNLHINKIEDNITLTINYKDIVFSNTINIKEDKFAIPKNDNTEVNFIYDDDCKFVEFEVQFKIEINDFNSEHSVILSGDYDEFIKKFI